MLGFYQQNKLYWELPMSFKEALGVDTKYYSLKLFAIRAGV